MLDSNGLRLGRWVQIRETTSEALGEMERFWQEGWLSRQVGAVLDPLVGEPATQAVESDPRSQPATIKVEADPYAQTAKESKSRIIHVFEQAVLRVWQRQRLRLALCRLSCFYEVSVIGHFLIQAPTTFFQCVLTLVIQFPSHLRVSQTKRCLHKWSHFDPFRWSVSRSASGSSRATTRARYFAATTSNCNRHGRGFTPSVRSCKR